MCICCFTTSNLKFLHNCSWLKFRDAFSRSPCALIQPSMKAAAEDLAVPDFGIYNSELYFTINYSFVICWNIFMLIYFPSYIWGSQELLPCHISIGQRAVAINPGCTLDLLTLSSGQAIPKTPTPILEDGYPVPTTHGMFVYIKRNENLLSSTKGFTIFLVIFPGSSSGRSLFKDLFFFGWWHSCEPRWCFAR